CRPERPGGARAGTVAGATGAASNGAVKNKGQETHAMPINPRPLRSVQFIPGNKERWIDRIPEMEADAYIFDLEDSVPDADRPAARQLVRAKLEKYGAEHPIFVRVNSLDSGQTFDDLDAVVCPGLYG